MKLFSSILRAFFGSMFGVFGALIALIIVLVIFGAIGSSDAPSSGPYEVLPNVDGKVGKLGHSNPLILFVDIKGVIGTEKLDAEEVRKQLQRSEEGTFRDRIAAIFLAVNSPGGSVLDSDTIYRMIQAYKEKYNVPVYAYAEGLCASGSLYISCAADKILASEVSLIGSVGVLVNSVNVSGTLDKIGAKAILLTQGKGKGAMNPLVPLKEGDEENLEEILAYYYEQFIGIVTTNRPKIDKQELINTYGAKVFPAPQALSYGYIDEVVDTQNVALQRLVEAANLTDTDYQIVQLKKTSWLESFLESKWLSFPPTGCLYLYERSLPY